MITGDYCIKLTAGSPQENCVCGKWALHAYIIHATAGFNCGHDLRGLFHAKQTTFSAVRIERCNRESRTFDSPSFQLAMSKMDDANNAVALDHPDCLR